MTNLYPIPSACGASTMYVTDDEFDAFALVGPSCCPKCMVIIESREAWTVTV